MNNSPEEIEKLLKRFYAASLSPDEMHSLYTYFLHTNPLPDRFKNDAPLVQAFAIRYFCQKERGALESKIDQWYENEKTATRSAKIISLSRTAMKRIVAVAACVAAVVVGLWQLRINSVLIPNTPEALQPSPTILATQTTDKPATITDNEIKNKPTAEQNTMPTTAIPQPDIIATAPIEQEHIPVLLAETETQIEIEQNLVADTAYMIADAGEVYDELQMYCSTRCLNNDVYVAYFNVTGENFI